MSEQRLIDANALKETFEKTVVVSPMPYAFVKQVIDNAPTIEPDCQKCKQYEDGYNYGRNIGYNEGKKERPQSEEGAIQYALGYQDGFLDAKKQFERVEADDCEGCKYEDKTPTELPCSECKHSHLNKFEWKEAKPYERPKPHPAAFCDGDCVHCKIIDECEKADGGES